MTTFTEDTFVYPSGDSMVQYSTLGLLDNADTTGKQ